MPRSSRLILASVLVVLTAGVSSAQTASTSSEVKTFEVIAVDGNDLVVRLPEGTRQINVPPGFVFTVNGKPMSVSDLRPGMSGTATITTTTTVTPVTVTEVKSGTVALVSGTAVYVRTPEGVRLFTQSELDKRGVKIFVDGKPRAVSELHEGDRLSATIVTTKPPSIVTEKEVQATLAKTGRGTCRRCSACAATRAGPERSSDRGTCQPRATACRHNRAEAAQHGWIITNGRAGRSDFVGDWRLRDTASPRALACAYARAAAHAARARSIHSSHLAARHEEIHAWDLFTVLAGPTGCC